MHCLCVHAARPPKCKRVRHTKLTRNKQSVHRQCSSINIDDYAHKVEDYQARDDVRFVRKSREAGETADNDESTVLTMCRVCETS